LHWYCVNVGIFGNIWKEINTEKKTITEKKHHNSVVNQVLVLLLSRLCIISWHSILAFVYIHNSQDEGDRNMWPFDKFKYQNSYRSKLRTTRKQRFPFTFFWHHFMITSLGISNIKILLCETNTKWFRFETRVAL